MYVAFVVYDGITALDLIGAYDPLSRIGTMGLGELDWDVCAPSASVTATGGLRVDADRVMPSLDGYDLVFVAGGFAARDLRRDAGFVEWIRSARGCRIKSSVCTGSLVLGAAGLLEGKRATTHPSAYELLAEYAEVVEDRVVKDGDVITGRGVSSSIDLGLYLVEILTDQETRREIQAQMDYPYGQGVLD